MIYHDAFKFYYLMASLKRQWRRPSELKLFQDALLRKVIDNAYKNIPFYGMLFDSISLKREDIKSTADLKKLPVLSKHKVRDAFINRTILNSVYKRDFISRKTSGSSGFPLTIVYDPKSYAYCEAIYARALFAQGG